MRRRHFATSICVLLSLSLAIACGDDDDPTIPMPDPPIVSTGTVGGLGERSAMLTGTVDAMGVESSYWFEYGSDIGYGSATPDETLAPTPAGVRSVDAQLTGLLPKTIYHYRLVARNSGGTVFGDGASFSTLPGNETPETQVATAPTDTLTGMVRWPVFWTGADTDGFITGFELRVANHGPDMVLDPADSLGVPWTITTVTDSILTWIDGLGARTLFVRAVDNLDARDPTPAQATVMP